MPKEIEIEWPDIKIKVSAKLYEDKNPKLCKILWDNLPIESIQSHSMATGEMLYCPIPVVEYVPDAYCELFSEMKVGSVGMSTADYKSFNLIYGKNVTEPLPWPVIGMVDEKDHDKLKIAGKAAFEANFLTHFPLKVIIRRKEK